MGPNALLRPVSCVSLEQELGSPKKMQEMESMDCNGSDPEHGIEWPMMMMAILASVMQCLGLVMPYFELAKRQGRVIGIDFWFLLIDYSGAFFSLMALVAQHTFDVLGGSMYIVAMTLETGIFLSQAIWLWRVRHIRHEAKKLGMTYDEYIEAHPSKKLARKASSETVADVEAAHTEETLLSEKSLSRAQQGASVGQETDADTYNANAMTEGAPAVPEKAVTSDR
ncbi:uncharacterized protein N0V89_007421 [Didymosphaeria variabile]|uniref:PQ-loop-domain-containing protein n=1 Tax=Didymosphaeria variabile TaxID=1932322 RepID=A0A9W9CA59_9PLEO|nr:uncharacterized protein N0V89_007421 [Didymosphaeria variabile]KAJ4352075.1 hypothetical protein N0V89_007421 [Didymosphaeria variabile]